MDYRRKWIEREKYRKKRNSAKIFSHSSDAVGASSFDAIQTRSKSPSREANEHPRLWRPRMWLVRVGPEALWQSTVARSIPFSLSEASSTVVWAISVGSVKVIELTRVDEEPRTETLVTLASLIKAEAQSRLGATIRREIEIVTAIYPYRSCNSLESATCSSHRTSTQHLPWRFGGHLRGSRCY